MEKPESFEESMSRLEEIVAELEKGELSLDESLKRYEEGIRSLRHCEAFLKKAEQKIKILLENEDGDLEEQPFDASDVPEEEAKPAKRSKESTKSKKDDLDGELDDDIPF